MTDIKKNLQEEIFKKQEELIAFQKDFIQIIMDEYNCSDLGMALAIAQSLWSTPANQDKRYMC